MPPELIPRPSLGPKCILENALLVICPCLFICNYAISISFLTCMSFHRHCKAARLPPNGLLQCGLLCPCFAPLFNILCKSYLFLVHLGDGFGLFPSLISPFLQVPASLLIQNLELLFFVHYLASVCLG